MLDGSLPDNIAKIIYGGNLIALTKKSGGIRPITIGYVYRRIAAKYANKYALNQASLSLAPRQVGVGVEGGIEAAVHAVRRYAALMSDEQIIVKLDFSNAFNCLRRDKMLEAVAQHVTQLYAFCRNAHTCQPLIMFLSHEIISATGAQQGDPFKFTAFQSHHSTNSRKVI